MATGVLSSKQLAWLDEQIEARMDQGCGITNLEKQLIGEIVGNPVPGLADIDMVRSFLENLDRAWDDTPNGLKNAFLAIMLNRILIWPETTTIRVQLIWRVGLTQEINYLSAARHRFPARMD
ncbi:MAG: hypothetical protein U0401_11805 [Anaerolineae bacterium]